ncbi:hypothetical protein HY346_00960 [Candidatus Microgenomates bacterium]|nr:hypothetical protein [Candidatus Microgenomates bacterium]
MKANPISWQGVQDKPGVLKRLKEHKERLEAVTPPDLTGDQKKKSIERLGLLRHAMVKGGTGAMPMPSETQMWKTSAGAIGQLAAWENYWKDHTLDPNGKPVRINRRTQKAAIWEVKDLQRVIDKDMEQYDPDVASIEKFRPQQDSPPLAEVPSRSYGLSPQARENYDAVFPDHQPTDVEAKLAEAKSQLITWERCQAITAKGVQCPGKTLRPDVPYCIVPEHKKQFEKGE